MSQRPRGHGPAVNTMRTVTTQALQAVRRGFSRRRRSVVLRRRSGFISRILRSHPVVLAVLLILIAAVMSVLISSWPSAMPWSSYLPLVVLAGLFLPPRWLALVLVAIAGLMAYDGWWRGVQDQLCGCLHRAGRRGRHDDLVGGLPSPVGCSRDPGRVDVGR